MDLRCGDFNEMLAPDVGNIRFDTPETGTFELEGYTIASQPSCGDPDYPYPAGDLNHDCRVDMPDFAILADHWLERENQRPHVYITAPPDGLEFCWLVESVWVTADAWDVDGYVVKVEFFANGYKIAEDTNGSDDWRIVTCFDIGTYILTAKATDNEGATAISPPVTIIALPE